MKKNKMEGLGVWEKFPCKFDIWDIEHIDEKAMLILRQYEHLNKY